MSLANLEQLQSTNYNINVSNINGQPYGFVSQTGSTSGPFLVYNQRLDAGHTASGHIDISIGGNNGVDYQVQTWSQYIAAANKGNALTFSSTQVGLNSAATSGTITTNTVVSLVLVGSIYYLQVAVSITAGLTTNVKIAANSVIFMN